MSTPFIQPANQDAVAPPSTASPEPWFGAFLSGLAGWTLDAFDFTIFLMIMVPISQEFHVPLTAVTAVFTITLWMRLVGATASGWVQSGGGGSSGVRS